MRLDDIRRVAVLGSGTMGPGIAQTFAQSGYPVTVWSKVPEEHVRAVKVVRASLETFVQHNMLQESEIEPTLKRMMVLGLVKRYDFTGLDLSVRNLENPDFLDPPLDNHPKSLFDLVEKGHLGVKTGKGF
jgi:3-hydroxyacyl-CoA dehydrogenase